MSVATLDDHSKVVETSDELESFFHVLLYNAVRYLKSNCTDAGVFIEDFFDTHCIRDDRYVCGLKKSETMQEHGQIRLVGSKDRLLFDSPLDTFFHQALKWFKAHYRVQAYRDSLAPPHPPPAQLDILPSASSHSDNFDDWESDDVVPAAPLDVDELVDSVPKPTQQEEMDALKVSSHAYMLQLLVQAGKSVWIADHVTGDNVSRDYSPQRSVGPARFRAATDATFKRARIGVPQDSEDLQTIAAAYLLKRIQPGANPRTPRRGRPDLKPSATAWL